MQVNEGVPRIESVWDIVLAVEIWRCAGAAIRPGAVPRREARVEIGAPSEDVILAGLEVCLASRKNWRGKLISCCVRGIVVVPAIAIVEFNLQNAPRLTAWIGDNVETTALWVPGSRRTIGA